MRIISVPATLIDTPEDVSIVAEMGTSIIASCVAFGSPAPEISWTMLQRGTTSVIGTNSTDKPLRVTSKQLVKNSVGIVYSSLLFCPTHPGALTTNMISCTTDNQVNGSNFTSHSFLVNVSSKHDTCSLYYSTFDIHILFLSWASCTGPEYHIQGISEGKNITHMHSRRCSSSRHCVVKGWLSTLCSHCTVQPVPSHRDSGTWDQGTCPGS